MKLDPTPTLGVLFRMRRYGELIDQAEFRMIEDPYDIEVRYLLALAYHFTGAHESAIHVLSSTGLPDTILNDQARSVSEIEAFMTLTNAMIATGIPEAVELGRSLATWNDGEDTPLWWGDIGWIALYRSCNYAAIARDEEALELLPRIGESRRLAPMSVLRDSWCFENYAENPVYLGVVKEQEARRAELRKKLPDTLATHGVKL